MSVAPTPTVLREVRRAVEEIASGLSDLTALLSYLAVLVQKLEEATEYVKEKDRTQKGNAAGRRLEGQILARELDMVLGSKLTCAIVSSPDGNRIGDVNDLIIKTNGTVVGVVVGVDGDKNIAVELERFEVTPRPDGGARVMLHANKEQLQQAPAFKSTVEQAQTSRAGIAVCG